MIWLPIRGYEGLYEVSEDGQVRSVLNGRNRLLRGFKSHGYSYVELSKDGKQAKHRIARLVATEFVRPPLDGQQVNHLDHNTNNDHFTNLEWVSPQENAQHAARAGRRALKLNPEAVKRCRAMAAGGAGQREIGRALGVSHKTVAGILEGRYWAHV